MNAPRCPHCAATLDGILHPGGDDIRPTPGALTVCAHCCCALVFGDELQLRLLSIEEFIALDQDAKAALGAVTATTAMIRLWQSHVAAEGKPPQTFEQLLRWALFGRKHDA